MDVATEVYVMWRIELKLWNRVWISTWIRDVSPIFDLHPILILYQISTISLSKFHC